MNPVLIDLGYIKIYWYSVMILLGVFIGGTILIKESRRFKIPEDYITNLIILTLIFSIIGARIYYVIFEWSYYSKNLLDIFKIWEGGLAIHGGIIFIQKNIK
jgi:phosphatidylglycerol:prolipoprotein diacylglycerol transferase